MTAAAAVVWGLTAFLVVVGIAWLVANYRYAVRLDSFDRQTARTPSTSPPTTGSGGKPRCGVSNAIGARGRNETCYVHDMAHCAHTCHIRIQMITKGG